MIQISQANESLEHLIKRLKIKRDFADDLTNRYDRYFEDGHRLLAGCIREHRIHKYAHYYAMKKTKDYMERNWFHYNVKRK